MEKLFAAYQIPLTEDAFFQLERYGDLLRQASEVQNLTSGTTLHEMWTRHFLDAAYILRYLTDSSKIIDLGTGGGIPGIPLAILNPSLQITLLDSEMRKIEFCKDAVRQLTLNVQAVCARAEEFICKAGQREAYDCAVSRAMANGSVLSELAFPFLRTGGRLIALKGRSFSMEAERFDSASAVLGGDPPEVTVYELEGESKTLVTVRKSAPTPEQYPRRYAKIKRNPL